MKNIKLLQVIPELSSGGAERGTLDIAKAIADSNQTSIVISNGGKLVPTLRQNGSMHKNLPVHSKNPFIMINNIKYLKRIISNYNINILHTRSRAPAWSSYFAGRNKVKLVSTFHNVYGHQNFLKRLYNSGLGKADSIIAISNYVKNEIIRLYKVPKEKITVIYRGIDFEKFHLEQITENVLMSFIKQFNIPYEKKIILYPARLTNWKGQIEFLKILRKIRNNDYVCIFVGDDKNLNYSKKLSNSIKSYGLDSKCKILGHIEDISCIYKLSHVVINASQKPEGFGRVVSEAMAMEKPVIAYDHGGVSEQIKDNYKSFNIPFNHNEQMIQAIEDVLIMPKDKIQKIVKKSKKFVEGNFSKQIMINNTINLYNKLLEKNCE